MLTLARMPTLTLTLTETLTPTPSLALYMDASIDTKPDETLHKSAAADTASNAAHMGRTRPSAMGCVPSCATRSATAIGFDTPADAQDTSRFLL